MLESPDGLKVEIQGLADYQPPTSPNAPSDQQMMLHLDFATDDVDAAVESAIEAGATVAEYQPQPHVKVMFDPAGHPFSCSEEGSRQTTADVYFVNAVWSGK